MILFFFKQEIPIKFKLMENINSYFCKCQTSVSEKTQFNYLFDTTGNNYFKTQNAQYCRH